MPPIPIYTDSPIAASKADGVTPQTAGSPSRASGQTAYYPVAQPGAPAAPAPTGYVPKPQPIPTQTIASSAAYHGPPPPQPGPLPVAPTKTANSNTYLPPPPKAGSVPSTSTTTTTTTPAVTAMPVQLNMPTPATNQAPTHSTYPGPSPTRSGPTTINLGPVAPAFTSQYAVQDQNLQTHPPGYKQDTFAQEMSAAQRASLEAQEAADRPRGGSLSSILGGVVGTGSSSSDGLGTGSGDDGGVWGAVKGFAVAAGQKAVELEESAWRKVNGE